MSGECEYYRTHPASIFAFPKSPMLRACYVACNRPPAALTAQTRQSPLVHQTQFSNLSARHTHARTRVHDVRTRMLKICYTYTSINSHLHLPCVRHCMQPYACCSHEAIVGDHLYFTQTHVFKLFESAILRFLRFVVFQCV